MKNNINKVDSLLVEASNELNEFINPLQLGMTAISSLVSFFQGKKGVKDRAVFAACLEYGKNNAEFGKWLKDETTKYTANPQEIFPVLYQKMEEIPEIKKMYKPLLKRENKTVLGRILTSAGMSIATSAAYSALRPAATVATVVAK